MGVVWTLSTVFLFCIARSCMAAATPGTMGPKSPKIWVYSLVAVDYGGSRLLGHFLQHYGSLGIADDQFHFDMLHDPDEPEGGLQDAVKLLTARGIDFNIIRQAYRPALQDIEMVKTLHRLSIPESDWIIVADTDEFFTYQHSTVSEAVRAMEAEGATYAMGEMLDHVSRDGSLSCIKEDQNIWEQFPLICPVVAEVAGGLPAKVVIHKGSLRVGAGHHHIVEPALAEAYFSKACSGPACEIVMKLYKQRTSVDIYDQTPYSRHANMIKLQAHRRQLAPGRVPETEVKAKLWSTWAKVHHFKWHSSLTENLKRRAERDSGDCKLGVNEETCKPNFQFWREVAKQYAAISNGPLNVAQLRCKEGIDTLWTW